MSKERAAKKKDDVERLEQNFDDMTYEQLAQEAAGLRERINRFRVALGRFFVDKQPLIDLMTICAVAQEPLLLVGVPGTAKSDLVLKFKDALQISDDNLLRQGRYIRRARGKLPTARLIFLDEIFKSNSAILNSLLTIINERKFYQDGVPEPVRLKVLFAATNEIPEHAELAALKDRFCLKAACRSVQDRYFLELIDAGLDAQTQRDLNQKPWAEGHATLVDFLKAHRYLTLQMGAKHTDADGEIHRDRDTFFKEDLLRELRRLLKTLVREDNIFVSDRKVIKLYRLLRTRAWVLHGGSVERQDLQLMSYLGETRDEIDLLEEKVPKLLGLS